jgi:septal ring factor EnvC (AmiA/AmiB activator)
MLQKKLLEEKREKFKTTQVKITSIEDEIVQLNTTYEEMQNVIQELEDRKNKTLEMKKKETEAREKFRNVKGNFPWPVNGTILACFGKTKDTALNTYIICHGLKIKSIPSSDVRAIDNGVVVYAKNFRSYGKTVIIDHMGGDYSIYGNLGIIEVKENQKISTKEIIGKSPKDGVIYFELRLNKEPVDPIAWLEKK